MDNLFSTSKRRNPYRRNAQSRIRLRPGSPSAQNGSGVPERTPFFADREGNRPRDLADEKMLDLHRKKVVSLPMPGEAGTGPVGNHPVRNIPARPQ